MSRVGRLAAVTAGLSVTGWCWPQAAWAAAGPQILAVDSIPQVISNLTAWIVGILAGVATLFLTLGGVRYLMAGGDPAEVERAKTALRSAAIGYGLAVLAPVIVGVLKSLVGG
jgi:Type IV secretion system pilin